MNSRYGIVLPILLFLFTTGIRGQTRDYWQQRVEYEMQIDMDADDHRFTGTQKLTYHNNSPDTLTRAYYHLYFNAFQPGSMMDKRSRTIKDPDSRVRDRISRLTDDQIGYHRINTLRQDGEPVTYEVVGTVMEVTLNDPIPPGESTVFEMAFDSQVPLQIRRSGRDNKEGVEFSMTQWYPKISEYDHKGWHPNPYVGREFHGVFGSFDVKVTIDSSYVLGSTGYLQNPQEIGHGYQEEGSVVNRPDTGRLTWHWKADDVHDFAWGADPDYTHTTVRVPGGPTLHFFYQADTVAANARGIPQDSLKAYWERLPRYTVRGFRYMSEHFGKYPYDKFSVIQGGDGGMEYPMATLITGNRSFRSLVSVTVHELVHSWYYGVLATNESRYPWMDEGFTSYADELVMDELFGTVDAFPHRSSYATYFGIVADGGEEAMDTHADHFVTNRAYSAASYSKGAVFLNQLRYIIGGEAFDRGMKRYFQTWKFRHPTGEDFIRVMEKEANMVLDWYYEYFITTTKTIDYGITTLIGDAGETHVTLKRHDLMPMPIDLMVEYTDGTKELFYIPLRIMRNKKPNEWAHTRRSVLTDWPWVYPTYTVTIPESVSSINQIEIDPSRRMADVNRDNNILILEKARDELGLK